MGFFWIINQIGDVFFNKKRFKDLDFYNVYNLLLYILYYLFYDQQ